MIPVKPQSIFLRPLVTVAAIVVIIAGVKAANSVVTPILFALFLTILLFPSIRRLEKLGLPKGLAITTISLISVASIILLFYYFYISTEKFIEKVPTYQEGLAEELTRLTAVFESWNIPTEVPPDVQSGKEIIQAITNLITSIISGGMNLFFFLLTLILMLSASDIFVEKFRKRYTGENGLAGRIGIWAHDVQKQFRIQTSNNVFTALFVGITYFLLGIDFAFLWTVITFVFAYIPNIGVILSSIPPIILALIQFGFPTALLTLILIVVITQVMDSVVTPRMMGRGLQTPALVVFLSFIFWTWILGPFGAFLAMPITLAIRSMLEQVPSTKFAAELLTENDEPAKKIERKKV